MSKKSIVSVCDDVMYDELEGACALYDPRKSGLVIQDGELLVA
ncbi:MAG: hypothetical protein JWN37_632 [Candidatus Nomurabacteria bacterium]|nr:hypothetical protein [Candidatus Nomurabacteria bacterium]